MSGPSIVIVGGAAMGSSVAAHLLADPAFRGGVRVVEKDPTYRLAASALSAASIRQQYSQPVNIAMSLYGIAFLREIAAHLGVDGERSDLGLHEGGYLYLAADRAAAARLAANHAVQVGAGADVVLLDPTGLAARFPWLETSGLALGAYGQTGEGWFDGWALLQGFRRKARSLGAQYVQDEVVGLDVEGDRIVGVELGSGSRLACDVLVDCAGSGGPAVAAMAGVEIAVQAKRRSVFSFTAAPLPDAPLLIDTTGVWMRPESRPRGGSQTFIAGWSPPAAIDPDWADADPASQEVDWPLFEEVVWPALAARIPALAELRPGRAWTGPYDMNLVDHNALIGPAPGLPNLILCNGFSGHGLQHSPAVGRGIAELLIHGAYRTLDLSDLDPRRLMPGGVPLLERNVI